MRKRILIINENVDEAEKIKERLVSAYNDVECVNTEVSLQTSLTLKIRFVNIWKRTTGVQARRSQAKNLRSSFLLPEPKSAERSTHFAAPVSRSAAIPLVTTSEKLKKKSWPPLLS